MRVFNRYDNDILAWLKGIPAPVCPEFKNNPIECLVESATKVFLTSLRYTFTNGDKNDKSLSLNDLGHVFDEETLKRLVKLSEAQGLLAIYCDISPYSVDLASIQRMANLLENYDLETVQKIVNIAQFLLPTDSPFLACYLDLAKEEVIEKSATLNSLTKGELVYPEVEHS